MPSPVLQIKRGNAGVAGTIPALKSGEPGFSLNNFDFFVGFNTTVAGNKFFGSHRYWGREDGTNSLKLKLVDKNGINGIHLKSPNTVSGIGTYILPDTNTITNGYFLKVATDGTLSWAASVDSGATFSNATLTGITTISGNLNVSANSSFTGITTISNVDINDGTLDGVVIGGATPDVGYFTLVDTDRLISDSSTIGIATATDFYIDSTRVLYDDGSGLTLAGIQTIDATTKSTLETILSLDLNDFTSLNVTGISTLATLNVTGNTTLGDASGDTITVNGTATFSEPIVGTISTSTNANNINIASTTSTDTTTSIVLVGNQSTGYQSAFIDSGIQYNANTDTLSITGDLAVNGGDLTSTATTFNLLNSTVTTGNIFGAGTAITLGAVTGTTTIRNNLVVGGDVRVNGNDIQASDGNTNITLTSNTLTTFAGDIRVSGNDIQSSTGASALTLAGSDVTVGGDITVGGNDIKASNGTTALTLTTSGAVTAANDLTVSGNLYVNGSTTQVNTSALTVEDRTIDLGIVNGSAPASTTTWDLGVLFNYFQTTAKKSALIWEQTDSRFKFASVLGADSDGSDNNTPQLTVTTFAPIEVAELWINNTCTGGTQQVIGCVEAELNIQNITVDAGSF